MSAARICFLVFAALIPCCFQALSADIIPKGWLDPQQLERAEIPIQQQLDTGRGMGGTAWGMAAVKDARLILIYIGLYEQLPDETSRKKLFAEQTAWLQRRQILVAALSNPDGGSIVSLEKAAKHMELTDKRIAELQKRLKP